MNTHSLCQSLAAGLATFVIVGLVNDAAALTLDQAISRGLENSPKLQIAASQASEARSKTSEAFAGHLPTVAAGATYLTSKNYLLTDVVFGGNPVTIPQIIPTSNFTLTATLPIFDGFATMNRLQSASHFEDAARLDLDWTKFQIEREITMYYFRAVAAKALKTVAEQNVKTFEDHLKDVSAFKKSGLSTNYDVLRVEVQLSEARSELLNSNDNVVLAKGRLAEAMGVDDVDDVTGELPQPLVARAEKIALSNLQTRMDLRAMSEKSAAYQDLEDAAGRHWIPRVSLFGQYNYYNNRNDEFAAWDKYRDGYQVGIALNWNLFDGLASQSRARQSVELRTRADKSLTMARLHAKQDLDVWTRKLQYFSSVYKSKISDIDRSKESVRLAREGRRVGVRTNTELLDAEIDLFRSQAGAVNAQLGALEAKISLELAAGQRVGDVAQNSKTGAEGK
ncbi:TolC family protein [soil metagenome]